MIVVLLNEGNDSCSPASLRAPTGTGNREVAMGALLLQSGSFLHFLQRPLIRSISQFASADNSTKLHLVATHHLISIKVN